MPEITRGPCCHKQTYASMEPWDKCGFSLAPATDKQPFAARKKEEGRRQPRSANAHAFPALVALVSGVVGAALLSGCVTPANAPRAGVEGQQDAASLRASDGMARVYVFSGVDRYALDDQQMLSSYDITVDGIVVGSLDPETYFFIDLAPGNYGFSWNERASHFATHADEALQLDLSSGDVTFIRPIDANISTGAGAAGGALGGLIEVLIYNATVEGPNYDHMEICPEQCPPLIRQYTLVVPNTDVIADVQGDMPR